MHEESRAPAEETLQRQRTASHSANVSAASRESVDKCAFVVFGLFVLSMVWFLPIVDAVQMLKSQNFEYWLGSSLPIVVVAAAVINLFFFFLLVTARFGPKADVASTARTHGVTILSIFVTIVGLVLVLASMLLGQHAVKAYTDLMYECQNSELTRDTYLVYLELRALRANPDCADMFSVEQCAGFKSSAESEFLKYMETDFRCSGFGDEGVSSDLRANVGVRGELMRPPNSSSVTQRHFRSARVYLESDSASHFLSPDVRPTPEEPLSASQMNLTLGYPPALFSTATFRSSCDGAAARNLELLAGGVVTQWWYVGIVCIIMSVVASLAKIQDENCT